MSVNHLPHVSNIGHTIPQHPQQPAGANPSAANGGAAFPAGAALPAPGSRDAMRVELLRAAASATSPTHIAHAVSDWHDALTGDPDFSVLHPAELQAVVAVCANAVGRHSDESADVLIATLLHLARTSTLASPQYQADLLAAVGRVRPGSQERPEERLSAQWRARIAGCATPLQGCLDWIRNAGSDVDVGLLRYHIECHACDVGRVALEVAHRAPAKVGQLLNLVWQAFSLGRGSHAARRALREAIRLHAPPRDRLPKDWQWLEAALAQPAVGPMHLEPTDIWPADDAMDIDRPSLPAAPDSSTTTTSAAAAQRCGGFVWLFGYRACQSSPYGRFQPAARRAEEARGVPSGPAADQAPGACWGEDVAKRLQAFADGAQRGAATWRQLFHGPQAPLWLAPDGRVHWSSAQAVADLDDLQALAWALDQAGLGQLAVALLAAAAVTWPEMEGARSLLGTLTALGAPERDADLALDGEIVRLLCATLDALAARGALFMPQVADHRATLLSMCSDARAARDLLSDRPLSVRQLSGNLAVELEAVFMGLMAAMDERRATLVANYMNAQAEEASKPPTGYYTLDFLDFGGFAAAWHRCRKHEEAVRAAYEAEAQSAQLRDAGIQSAGLAGVAISMAPGRTFEPEHLTLVLGFLNNTCSMPGFPFHQLNAWMAFVHAQTAHWKPRPGGIRIPYLRLAAHGGGSAQQAMVAWMADARSHLDLGAAELQALEASVPEYIQSADVEHAAVRLLGQCLADLARRLPEPDAARLDTLVTRIGTRLDHRRQSAIETRCNDLWTRFEAVFPALCNDLEAACEPDRLHLFLWHLLDNADLPADKREKLKADLRAIADLHEDVHSRIGDELFDFALSDSDPVAALSGACAFSRVPSDLFDKLTQVAPISCTLARSLIVYTQAGPQAPRAHAAHPRISLSAASAIAQFAIDDAEIGWRLAWSLPAMSGAGNAFAQNFPELRKPLVLWLHRCPSQASAFLQEWTGRGAFRWVSNTEIGTIQDGNAHIQSVVQQLAWSLQVTKDIEGIQAKAQGELQGDAWRQKIFDRALRDAETVARVGRLATHSVVALPTFATSNLDGVLVNLMRALANTKSQKVNWFADSAERIFDACLADADLGGLMARLWCDDPRVGDQLVAVFETLPQVARTLASLALHARALACQLCRVALAGKADLAERTARLALSRPDLASDLLLLALTPADLEDLIL